MSDLILKLENLNLVFQTSVHRPWTWREVFVRTIKDPFDLLPKSKDRLHVAKDVNFEVRSGERVALMGVNGAGKTSICRCIAGYYRPTSGDVSIRGKVRALFDTNVGIRPELTGRENAYLLAELLYPEDKNKKEFVEEALEFSELQDFLDVPFKLYSKGMQARLGLSLSALKPADLLVLDEVFDGADVFFKEKISARMLEIIDQSGAVIFVSHSPDQVLRVCNRMLILDGGRIVYDGGVDRGLEVYDRLRPQSPAKNERELLSEL